MKNKFKKGEKIIFEDGFSRSYKAKIKVIYFDKSIKQHHYSFENIESINHNPKYDFVPKTTEKDTILEVQIERT